MIWLVIAVLALAFWATVAVLFGGATAAVIAICIMAALVVLMTSDQ